MTDKAHQVARIYLDMLGKIGECMASMAGSGHDLKDVISGMQIAHLTILRNNFLALQAAEAPEHRRRFDAYLREMADHYHAVDASPPGSGA